MKKYFIRSKSWGAANISWSVVIEELLFAAEQMGHEITFISTNGYKGMKYWTPEKSLELEISSRSFLKQHGSFDIDITYTVPQNFPQRFLSSSKCKMAIYAYESSIMPQHWSRFYHMVDYVLPPSQYCAEMIERNGCPKEKIKVVPHGVDLNVFNENVKPLELGIDKKVRFLCLAEPHYRKQLDKLLRVYCENFTSKDDVCLVLKTKVFQTAEEKKSMAGYEMDILPVLKRLKVKYGNSMPMIRLVPGRLENIASLYAACDAFTLMTASEGWGVPYLEALAMGMPVIAPKHGGQLDFLDDSNSVLTPCGWRRALPQEQYWGGHPKALVGKPDEKEFGKAMRKMYEELFSLKLQFKDRGLGVTSLHKEQVEDIRNKYDSMKKNALDTARRFTWANAMGKIIQIAEDHNDRL